MVDSESLVRRGRLISFLGGYSKPACLYRRYRPRWFWAATSPFGRPTYRYVKEQGTVVKRGAFEGMVYPLNVTGHVNYLSSKLIGTYEPEVTEFIRQHLSESDLFVDLGSAEGFFCVGVARQAPLKVIGYEMNKYERDFASAIAKLNDVTIELRGEADAKELNGLPEGRLLLLCDIEGVEEDLLDPELVPRLKESLMVVESHEQFRPNVVKVLTERFEATHHVEHVMAKQASPAGYPEVEGWDEEAADMVVFDGHHDGDSWMTFVPK
ncbi:MAG: hypothetical protein WBW44_08895 [Solirubrobacterales bacterium]